VCACVFSEVVLGGGMVLADCPGWQISFVDVCVCLCVCVCSKERDL